MIAGQMNIYDYEEVFPMQLIGVNGRRGSGKGEVASYIAHDHEYTYEVGFSDNLKVLGARALGFTGPSREDCIEWIDRVKDVQVMDIRIPGPRGGQGVIVGRQTVRQFIQNLGHNARGVFGQDFWINQVLPVPALVAEGWPEDGSANEIELLKRYPYATHIVMTDLRYPNEAQRVRALGGKIIEVIRPNVAQDKHESERPLPADLIDHTIYNDGPLALLRAAVKEII